MIDLWPHQLVAIDRAQDAIKRGVPSGLVASPCGTGKTTIFTELARRLDWPALVLCHRDELIRQTVDTFSIVWPDATVGVIKAERDEWRSKIQPAHVLGSLAAWTAQFDLPIWLAGTHEAGAEFCERYLFQCARLVASENAAVCVPEACEV